MIHKPCFFVFSACSRPLSDDSKFKEFLFYHHNVFSDFSHMLRNFSFLAVLNHTAKLVQARPQPSNPCEGFTFAGMIEMTIRLRTT